MSNHSTSLSRVPFAQKSKLTVLLHQLVRSYPRGVGVIHEFIQNADDAGATSISVVLDERQHASGRLPTTAMSCLQGPALVVVNDASFSDEDWERIQSTGRSGKLLDTSKTGRFGLGFNSVYNVTDWPGVVTRDRVGFFDPHGGTVGDATRDEPGDAWRLTEELWKACPDFLTPFRDFGLDAGATEIPHTIFRFPLRTVDAAEASEVCDQPFAREDFISLTEKLVGEAGELLLFLKHLHEIRVRRIDRDSTSHDLVTIRTLNTDEVTDARRRVHDRLEADFRDVLQHLRNTEPDELVSEYTHRTVVECAGRPAIEQDWSVVQALVAGASDELLHAAEKMFDYEEKAVPLVGAASLAGSDDGRPRDGRLFCTLPLSSVSSFLPFHINGFFDLQSDRQGIFSDEGAEGKAAVRVLWNRSLLEHGCADVAARLLTLQSQSPERSVIYSRWPRVPASEQTLLQVLPGHVYRHLCDYECIPCGPDHRLRAPEDASLLPGDEQVVRDALLANDVTLANPVPPQHVIDGFRLVEAPFEELSPNDVRELIRVSDDPSCELADAPQAALRSKDWVVALLRYCCSDGALDDLKGVPLAITEDGYLHAFGLGEDPLLIANAEERVLLQALPGLVLDETLSSETRLAGSQGAGITLVTPKTVVALLPRFLKSLDGTTSVEWNAVEEGVPTEEWLVQFYSYLADRVDECDLTAGVLQQCPLVPDQFGVLWPMGLESTPLLPSANRTHARLVDALRPFRVPVVDGGRDLLAEIRRFVEAADDSAIWRITGRDLVDTLAAVRDDWDSTTAKYSQDVHGVVLSFLATADARKGAGERKEKLRALPIFPTTDGGLVDLDSDAVFLPAGYSLPRLDTGLGFLNTGPNGTWLPLFEVLGVPSLTRARFVREVLFPRYAEVTADDQIDLLQWLRTNLEEAFNELDEADASAFQSELSDAELVCCTDGRCHAGRELYHPATEEAFGAVLGSGAGFPDMEVYSSRHDSWYRLFQRLGMESQPRAIDLLRAVDEATAQHADDPEAAVALLQKIAAYVQSHWVDLRDIAVNDDPVRPSDADEWTLLEALSKRCWLPVQEEAPRGFPRGLFASQSPSLRHPSDLYARDLIDLVSLVAPLSRFELGGMGNDIGLRSAVEESTTLEQLRAVLADARSSDGGERLGGRTVSILQRLYRQLGSLYPPLSEQDAEAREAIAAIRQEFFTTPCVVDESAQLWRPGFVFSSPVPYFGRHRAQVRARHDQVDRGLDVLGRNSTPSAAHFVDYFVEVEDECAGEVVEEEARELLRDAYRHAARVDDPEGHLRNAPVLTSTGHLEHSDQVVIDDAEWLSERARQAGLHILDESLDMTVAHAFAVTAMSRAVFERPCQTRAIDDESFAALCSEVEAVVRSDEFQQGVRRLLGAEQMTERTGALAWLGRLSIRPVSELVSELVWLDGQEAIENSEGRSDVLFDPDADEIVVSVDARDVLSERVASVIAHELRADGCVVTDLSPLAAMLRNQPANISDLLTRLRIPKLIEDSQEVFFDEEADAGFIDDECHAFDDEADTEPGAGSSEEGAGHTTDAVSDDGDLESDRSADGRSQASKVDSTEGRAPGVDGTRAGNEAKRGKPTERGEKPDDETSTDRVGDRTQRDSVDTETDGEDRDDAVRQGPGRSTGRGSGPGVPGDGPPSHSRSRSERSRGRGRRAVTYVNPDNEPSREESPDATAHRSAVDQAAIEIVLRYERESGRHPEPKEHFHPGCDIESTDGEGEILRFIEVKGLSGPWNDFGVGVKPRQIQKCREEPERFWLYVVEFALEPERAEVFAIPNPVSLIDEYRFDGGWKGLSRERYGSRHADRPDVGTRVQLSDSRIGVVDAVERRGALMRLTVRFQGGDTEQVVYAPSRVTVLADTGDD